MSAGEDMLDAIRDRLLSIKIANNYPINVKEVIVSHNELTMQTASERLPLIEIVQGDEFYEHTSGSVERYSEIGFRLVEAKGKTDRDMETFKSAVIRCLFCNSYTNNGVANLHLSTGMVAPRLLRCTPDYGAISANRIYVIVVEVKLITPLWRF